MERNTRLWEANKEGARVPETFIYGTREMENPGPIWISVPCSPIFSDMRKEKIEGHCRS